ncbi:MAG: hypothetical protein KF888_08790 [Nitrosomonas sp.]|nr:hypothetical protein [Nitrosomonas sp.]
MSKEIIKKSNRRKFILILVLLFSPVVISYALFFMDYRPGSINYGDLVEIKKLSGSGVTQDSNIILRMRDLHGKWVMLTVDSGNCDEACQKKLYYMRQVRTMQNKEMNRIERLWLIDDNVKADSELFKNYEGTFFVNALDSELLDQIPTREIQRKHIYLIDPMGNLMMRFPENLEPRKMSDDIKRLLHVSQMEH